MKTRTKKHVRMVKPQFVEAILAGRKKRTIRPIPKRKILKGDILDIRQWEGLPYRSKQIPVILAVVQSVRPVTITKNWIILEGVKLPRPHTANDFAIADGFTGCPAMRDWFQKQHGLPFTGQLIEWELYYNENDPKYTEATVRRMIESGVIKITAKGAGFETVIYLRADTSEVIERSVTGARTTRKFFASVEDVVWILRCATEVMEVRE